MRVAGSDDAEKEHEELRQEHTDDEGVGDIGMLGEQIRTRHHALNKQTAQEYGRSGTAGDGEREERDAGRGHGGVIGAFGSADAFRIARTETLRILIHLLHLIVAHQAGHLRTRARDNADDGTEYAADGECTQILSMLLDDLKKYALLSLNP